MNLDLNILIVGPYPPPFGGISSLIRSLVDGLKRKDVKEVVILYFGNKDNIRMNLSKVISDINIVEKAMEQLEEREITTIYKLTKIKNK